MVLVIGHCWSINYGFQILHSAKVIWIRRVNQNRVKKSHRLMAHPNIWAVDHYSGTRRFVKTISFHWALQ